MGGCWAERYRDYYRASGRKDDPAVWNRRAASYSDNPGQSVYAQGFLEELRLDELCRSLKKERLSILDIGCGPGTLALPLAAQGHELVCVDFSSQMLEVLESRAAAQGLSELVHTTCLAWEDDWKVAGLGPCDVVIASRSSMVADLSQALRKMDEFALHRAALSFSYYDNPKYDPVLSKYFGCQQKGGIQQDFVLNILKEQGIEPRISHITCMRESAYETKAAAFEAARKQLSREWGAPLSSAQEQELRAYMDKHLMCDKDGGAKNPLEAWRLDYQHEVEWIFVSWDKSC